jgi:ribonuclease P protein subunit POP4
MIQNLNAKTLHRHELIGLKMQVVKSTHKELCDLSGTIIDETKNTLVISHKSKLKVIPKGCAIFHCILSDGTTIEIDGKLLIGRPEDRIKKRR